MINKFVNHIYKAGTLYLALMIIPVFFCMGQANQTPLLKSWDQYKVRKNETRFGGLTWRTVGPSFNGGRVEAVSSPPGQPGTIYVGYGSGNLWKTTDHGLHWDPVFDDQAAYGIGDVEVAPSDGEVVWLGTGENLRATRGFTIPGTGVFRSGDGGKTWVHKGLSETYHIARILVDNEDPGKVYVAALGHFWTRNEERGLFRTIDSGKNWEKILYISDSTGVSDVVIHPENKDIIFAASWDCTGKVAGEETGIFRSIDGGINWIRLSGGFPAGKDISRIGLAISAGPPYKLYALVDNRSKPDTVEEGVIGAELYRSENMGDTWIKTHEDDLPIYAGFGWAFGDLRVSPDNSNEVYLLGVKMVHSTDAGKTFDYIWDPVDHIFPNAGVYLHLDQHDLWIDPDDPNHLVLGNDGGVFVSYNRGRTWLHYNNMPVGEFYCISADSLDPYNVYGGTQDNSSVFGPVNLSLDDGYADNWQYVWVDPWSGGDGFVTLADPLDPNIKYYEAQGGAIQRKNMSTGENVSIRPSLEEEDEKIRYEWQTPYFISHHNPLTLYFGGSKIFKSLNRGDDWNCISPDLTESTNPDRKSRGVTELSESAIKPGLLYAGTNLGMVWITQNDGVTWRERSGNLPHCYVKDIEPSSHEDSIVYIVLSGIEKDDFTPYVFVSENYGVDWKSISSGLPDEPVNTLLEDPGNPDILYAGTFRSVYVSVDRGKHWEMLGTGMPACFVQDLIIQPQAGELIAATHGRSIFVMDIRGIQQYFDSTSVEDKNAFFDIPTAKLPCSKDYRSDWDLRSRINAKFTFYLIKDQPVELTVTDPGGESVFHKKWKGNIGFNELDWDLVKEVKKGKSVYALPDITFADPGDYKVVLSGKGFSLEQKLIITEAGNYDK